MNGEKLWEKMQEIDPEYIEDASHFPEKKNKKVSRIVGLITCGATTAASGSLLYLGNFTSYLSSSVSMGVASNIGAPGTFLMIVLCGILIVSIVFIIKIVIDMIRKKS